MADCNEFEDAFYETESSSGSLIRLSHLNNKSSVLCPEKQDITSQYLVLQQLDAHQRMISRAKSIVDTSAPKSLQSYISVADRQRKKHWHKPLKNESNELDMENLNGTYKQQTSSRLQTPFSEEEDNISLNASSVNKGVQTGIPFETVSSKTADKISWYLDALNHGELYSQPFICTDNSRNVSRQSNGTLATSKFQKKVVKGDIMDWHEKSFVKPKKPFSPRILANSSTKAKLKDMRCYNPPFRKKKSGSSHSSDTFESYDNDEESEDIQKSSATSSVEEEAQVELPQPSDRYSNFKHAFLRSSLHQNRDYFEPSYNSDSLTRTEEDEYLSFLSKVTEDILRSGVYSDKAIQQSFEFHMQFYKEESNKEKLQSLLNQVLDGLKISSDDSEETDSYRHPLLINFSRPNTPPERESLDILSTNNPLIVGNESNLSTIQSQTLNPHPTNEANPADLQINQSTPPDNMQTLEDES